MEAGTVRTTLSSQVAVRVTSGASVHRGPEHSLAAGAAGRPQRQGHWISGWLWGDGLGTLSKPPGMELAHGGSGDGCLDCRLRSLVLNPRKTLRKGGCHLSMAGAAEPHTHSRGPQGLVDVLGANVLPAPTLRSAP